MRRSAISGWMLSACVVIVTACGSNGDGSDALDAVQSTTTSTTTPVFIADDDDSATSTDDARNDRPDDANDGDEANGDASGSPDATMPTNVPGQPDTPAPGTSDADCVIGTWRLQGQPYLEALVRAVDDVGQITSVQERGGQYVFVFGDDGAFVARREAWVPALGTIQGTIVTTITSDEPGSYRVSDGVVTIESVPNTPVINIRLEGLDGSVRDVAPGETLTVGTDPVGGSHSYTCSDASLVVSLPTTTGATVDATFDRIG